MNVFYLHHCAAVAAGMHCDKHVGKMLIESAQMLATAHHHFGNGDHVSYKPTHKNHPSNVWVRSSRLHYDYVVELALALGRQFYVRYGKRHKTHLIVVEQLMKAPPAMLAMPLVWQDPPLAMPDEYKSPNTIDSYRRFYASKIERMPMVYFKGTTPPPYWLSDIWATSLKAA